MAQQIKLVTVGDNSTGKTCLFIAYAKNAFPEEYIPTVFENYVADDIVNGIPVSVGLWDTHGVMEDLDRLRPLSYFMTDVFLICFSIDKPESLTNVKMKWVPELRHHCPNTPIVLVACKIDLREKSSSELVTSAEGSKVARDLELGYVETSARTREGVQDSFNTAIMVALRDTKMTVIQPWFSCGKRALSPPVMPPAGKAPRIEVETSRFAEDWIAMHENPVNADVTFVLGGQHKLDSHKIVLCSASTYFRRVFGMMSSNEAKTSKSTGNFTVFELNQERVQGIVAVYDQDRNAEDVVGQGHCHTVVELSHDIKPKAFVRVLEFLYSGVPNLTNDEDQVEIDDIVDVMELSDTFNLPRLAEICQNCLTNQEFLNPSVGTSLIDETIRTMTSLYFNKPETADVILKVRGRKIYAHKTVIAARCKLLADTIESHFKESHLAILELEIPADGFIALLEYLYSDHAPVEDIDRMELIALADKYGQKRLVNLCELYVTKEINKSVIQTIEKADIDVIGLLQTSQNYNAEQLSSWCLHFISTNYPAFKNRKEFSSLKEENKTYIEDNQWPPVSYLRKVEAYRKKWKTKGDNCSSKCAIL
ncbi:rho-related protein racA-like [Pecten maximus]|uniref:rho-related protein racA-like n=1 Tax=Pecten maximus TaxID=6579 RepID=UPI0014590DF6|nr:rho-related protein racA-like [Pecten maximus]